jgi:hypothetical protein
VAYGGRAAAGSRGPQPLIAAVFGGTCSGSQGQAIGQRVLAGP